MISYVPILKSKRGELQALGALSEAQAEGIAPLIELTHQDLEIAPDVIPAEFIRTAESIRKQWKDRPFFVDFDIVSTNYGVEAAIAYLRILVEKGCACMPAIGSMTDRTLVQAISAAAQEHNLSTCVAVMAEDFSEPWWELEAAKLARKVKAEGTDCYLLLDFADQIPPAYFVHGMLQRIKKDWTAVIIAGGSFPETMSNIAVGTSSLERKEWTMFQDVVRGLKQEPAKYNPIFGDYAITHPALVDFDPVRMQSAAKIKYTSGDNWIVFRARSLKKHGYDQFCTLTQEIVRHPAYRGRQFSAGDETIDHCASGKTGTGNQETWVIAGTNHHLVTVMEQLANVPASSAKA